MKTKPQNPPPSQRALEPKKKARKPAKKETPGASPLDRLSDLIENEGGTTGTRSQNRSATSTIP